MNCIIEVNENKYQAVITENNGNSIWQSIYSVEIVNNCIQYYTNDEYDITEDITKSKPVAKLYVCRRGVWDNRIYFPDDNEYFINEFYELHEVIKEVEKITMDIIENNI